MDLQMSMKIVIIICFSVIAIIGIGRAIFNYKKSYKNSEEYIRDRIFDFNIGKYIKNLIRDNSFFKMLNAGDDPCELEEDLQYFDYISKEKIYWENKKNG